MSWILSEVNRTIQFVYMSSWYPLIVLWKCINCLWNQLYLVIYGWKCTTDNSDPTMWSLTNGCYLQWTYWSEGFNGKVDFSHQCHLVYYYWMWKQAIDIVHFLCGSSGLITNNRSIEFDSLMSSTSALFTKILLVMSPLMGTILETGTVYLQGHCTSPQCYCSI